MAKPVYHDIIKRQIIYMETSKKEYPQKEERAEASGKRGLGTVMILEDERPLLEVVQLKLEGNGFDVITARSVAQAVDFLTHMEHIDAVWVDHYLLGTEDGIGFVALLKEHPAWRLLPVFVVSNADEEDTRKDYLAFGVDKYYVKADTRLDDIVADLKRIVGEKR